MHVKRRSVVSYANRKIAVDFLCLGVILSEIGALYYHVSAGRNGHSGQPFHLPGGFDGELLVASVWVSTLLVIPSALSIFWAAARLYSAANCMAGVRASSG